MRAVGHGRAPRAGAGGRRGRRPGTGPDRADPSTGAGPRRACRDAGTRRAGECRPGPLDGCDRAILGPRCRPPAPRRAARPARPAPTPARGPRRAAPVLARQVRGDIEESVHRGHVVEVDATGVVTHVAGDPEVEVTLRSTVKPFALLALVEAGGFAAFDLTPPEIAIMASSHSGEDLHVRTLQAIFRRSGAEPDAPRLRHRGRAARRPDGRPPGPRRREGRPDPPHVLGPARRDAPARPARRLEPRGLLDAGAPGRRSPYRAVVARAFGIEPERLRIADRRLRRRDVRRSRCAGWPAPTRCWPTRRRSRRATRGAAWRRR